MRSFVHFTRVRWVAPVLCAVMLLAGCWNDFPEEQLNDSIRVTRETHTEFFPIQRGSTHESAGCEDCHGGMTSFREFTCIECHEHRAEVTQPPHVAIEGFTYSATSCLGCHTDGTVERVDHEVHFPISTGSPHGELICGDCHREPQKPQAFECADCHEHRAEILDPAHAKVEGYTRSSPDCYRCHPQGTAEKVDHEVLFPIGSGSTHDALFCGDCHRDEGDRSQFICGECHEHRAEVLDPAHVPIAGYSRLASDCLDCHRTGEAERIDHDPAFPIDDDAPHGGLSCADCHVEQGVPESFVCGECHEHRAEVLDPAHAGVGGYDRASTSCYSCHPRGEASPVDHSEFFPIGPGTDHGDLDCASCHIQPGEPEIFDCGGCHTHRAEVLDPAHAGVRGYDRSPESCLGCHEDGEVDRVDHTPFFPTEPGTNHGTLVCGDCHVVTGEPDIFICGDCHTHRPEVTDPLHVRVDDYSRGDGLCKACHPQGTAEPLVHDPYFPIGDGTPHGAVQCSECHSVPWDRTQFECTTCHTHRQEVTDPSHAPVPDYRFDDTACLECHADGLADRTDHTPIFPLDPGTPHENALCSDCHVEQGNPDVFLCTGCHEHRIPYMDDVHRDVSRYSSESSACYQCHPTGEALTREEHDPYFPIARGDHRNVDCFECHIPPDPPPAFECIFCHEHRCPDMNDEHREVPNYQCESPRCYDCHPRGEE